MIETVITRMIAYNHGDARRIHHALKVYALASAIAGEEKMPERGRMVLEAAAVLTYVAWRLCHQRTIQTDTLSLSHSTPRADARLCCH